MDCGRNPKYLGAMMGAVAILHSWGQNLNYHPHIHMMVPAGGLSEDGMEWIHSSKKFLLPVKRLSRMFRSRMCRLIKNALDDQRLGLPDDVIGYDELQKACYKKKWVVYCEKPFKCPDNLIAYLGNYTHRVAISSHRIIDCKDGKVTFWYKDYRSGGIRKEMTVTANEFIRRFLQHALPRGFSKIRYFGIMALANLKKQLDLCIELINRSIDLPQLVGLNGYEVYRMITGVDPLICPICKSGVMKILHLVKSG